MLIANSDLNLFEILLSQKSPASKAQIFGIFEDGRLQAIEQ